MRRSWLWSLRSFAPLHWATRPSFARPVGTKGSDGENLFLVRVRRCGKALGLAAVLSTGALGCGGTPTAPGADDVFYLHGGGVLDKNKSYEAYYPRFDRDKTDNLPRYVGVGVLDGDVRFRRPTDWTL